MKAAVYDQAGTPEVLRYANVPDPECGDDEVLVRVEAISIEGGDTLNRAYTQPPNSAYVGGYAASGVIMAIGSSVHNRSVGQRVTTWNPDGSHAQLRAVPARRTWLVPDALDIRAAAALPIYFGTASHSLFARGKLQAGQTVMIQGGAGGVGLAAIQLAHQAGARVLATASSLDHWPRLEALGLSHAIDYTKEDVRAAVMDLTGGQGVDLVVDPVGSTLAGSLEVLRPEGRLVFVGNAGGASLSVDLWPALQANQTLHGVFMGTQFEKPEVYSAVEELLRLAGAQQLEVLIDSCFPLSDAVLAHHRAEQRTLGRVVMLP